MSKTSDELPLLKGPYKQTSKEFQNWFSEQLNKTSVGRGIDSGMKAIHNVITYKNIVPAIDGALYGIDLIRKSGTFFKNISTFLKKKSEKANYEVGYVEENAKFRSFKQDILYKFALKPNYEDINAVRTETKSQSFTRKLNSALSWIWEKLNYEVAVGLMFVLGILTGNWFATFINSFSVRFFGKMLDEKVIRKSTFAKKERTNGLVKKVSKAMTQITDEKGKVVNSQAGLNAFNENKTILSAELYSRIIDPKVIDQELQNKMDNSKGLNGFYRNIKYNVSNTFAKFLKYKLFPAVVESAFLVTGISMLTFFGFFGTGPVALPILLIINSAFIGMKYYNESVDLAKESNKRFTAKQIGKACEYIDKDEAPAVESIQKFYRVHQAYKQAANFRDAKNPDNAQTINASFAPAVGA